MSNNFINPNQQYLAQMNPQFTNQGQQQGQQQTQQTQQTQQINNTNTYNQQSQPSQQQQFINPQQQYLAQMQPKQYSMDTSSNTGGNNGTPQYQLSTGPQAIQHDAYGQPITTNTSSSSSSNNTIMGPPSDQILTTSSTASNVSTSSSSSSFGLPPSDDVIGSSSSSSTSSMGMQDSQAMANTGYAPYQMQQQNQSASLDFEGGAGGDTSYSPYQNNNFQSSNGSSNVQNNQFMGPPSDNAIDEGLTTSSSASGPGLMSGTNSQQGMTNVSNLNQGSSLGPSGFAQTTNSLKKGSGLAIAPATQWNSQELPRPVDANDPGANTNDGKRGYPLEYSAGHSFVQFTTDCAPDSAGTLKKAGVPFGAVVHPLAEGPGVPLVPTVEFGEIGIVRCFKCRTYINPFVSWIENGRRWRCNLCFYLNDVPTEYYCVLDSNGVRRDVKNRPELCYGSVEYVAPEEYCVRPPQPPAYLFVIDVTWYSQSTGMLNHLSETLKQALDNLPGDERTLVGFLAFDNSLHFVNLSPELSQPQILVVSDITDPKEQPFVPLPRGFLVELASAKEQVDAFVDIIPSMWSDSKTVDSALGPAIKAAQMILGDIGGKMLLFHSALPNVGMGALKNRLNLNQLGTDQEISMLTCGDKFYKETAADLSRLQISVDVFSFAASHNELSTVGNLAKYTGGQVYYYSDFGDSEGRVLEKFSEELDRCLTRTTGFEAVMRIRCSRGLNISSFHGHFFIRSSDLLSIPTVDCDKTYAVQMTPNESQVNCKTCFIQSALLYTSCNGQRLIRVHTASIPVSNLVADVIRSVNIDAMSNLLARKAVSRALVSNLQGGRDVFLNQCMESMTAYYNHLPNSQRQGTQLQIPESLRLLPLSVLGFIKNAVMKTGNTVRPDRRFFHMSLFETVPVSVARDNVSPLLFAIHKLREQDCIVDMDKNTITMPELVPLTINALEASGAYIVYDGIKITIWVGGQASSNLTLDMFDLDSLDNISGQKIIMSREIQNPLTEKLWALIDHLRIRSRPFFPMIEVVKQGEAAEGAFFAALVEDRTSTVMSMYEYLTYLQREVNK